MRGNFDGAAWQFSHENTGCAGMDFQISSTGQVQYKTTDFTTSGSGTIQFRAKTIDQ